MLKNRGLRIAQNTRAKCQQIYDTEREIKGNRQGKELTVLFILH